MVKAAAAVMFGAGAAFTCRILLKPVVSKVPLVSIVRNFVGKGMCHGFTTVFYDVSQ